jgi:hypothetical protein
MEEAPENGKESSHSAHDNGMNEWMEWMNEWMIRFVNQLKNQLFGASNLSFVVRKKSSDLKFKLREVSWHFWNAAARNNPQKRAVWEQEIKESS